MDSLPAAITAYQSALDRLPVPEQEGAPSPVLGVLLARDHLAQALGRIIPSAAELTAIAALDQRLQAGAADIDQATGRTVLAGWRAALQPPASAWWWRLDERAVAAEPQPSALWTVAAGFFLTISISLSAEIARRFLTVGPDFVGVFSTLVQGGLALAAGRSLTGAGVRSMERVLAYLKIKQRHAHAANAVLALAVMLLVVGLRLSLPAIARAYNDQGVRQQQIGQVAGAIQSYQRATSLAPNYAAAHYNLGAANEIILAYDPAVTAYQTALHLDPRLYAAYNNLARLYMRQKSDFANALALLDYALDLKLDLTDAEQAMVRYALLKNRAWANLGLKYLTLAESDARQALELRPDGAAAHCLLAQVLEAQGQAGQATASWESCLRYEKTDVVPVEAQWLALARERLSAGASK